MNTLKSLLRSAYAQAARRFYGKGLGRRIPLIRSLNSFLRSRLVNADTAKPVRVMGHVMYVDPNDSLSISVFGAYEPQITQLFQELIKPGDIVVDIGANIGWYTLIAARQVGSQGRVFAFEPAPDNFALLQRNVQANKYTNVTLFAKAVSDQSGKLRLFLDEVNRGGHTTHQAGAVQQYVEVDAVRLDDVLASDISVNFIKIDVEGAEADVLRGMPAVLARSPALHIIAEYSPAALARAGAPPADFLRQLVNLGFDLEEIDDLHHTVQPTTIDTLLAKFSDQTEDHTNLKCSRPATRRV